MNARAGNAYGINAANLGRANCRIERGDFDEAESILNKTLASTKENNLMFLHFRVVARDILKNLK